MKAFIKNFNTGEFGEFFVTADMNISDGNEITFEVDPSEVYPGMVSSCNVSAITKLTANKDDCIFEDELLEKIISDIETEVKNIKEASDNIANEEIGNWSEDHLLMIDSRIEIINENIRKFRQVLDAIYTD